MKRARRHRSRVVAVVAVVVVIVAGGWFGLRSHAETGSRSASESTHPSTPRMHNGSLDVVILDNPAGDGVRSLTLYGAAKSVFPCSGSCPEVGEAAWSPDGTRLAFTDLSGGVHVVDAARGTDRLILSGGRVFQLAWSPDGTRIAYVQDQQILVMNEDGSGQTPVTPILHSYLSHPSWSPDGSRIVYATLSGRLFVVGLDGSAPTPLVKGSNPAWSPDGTKIAYSVGCDVRVTTPDGRDDSNLIDLAAVRGLYRCKNVIDLQWSPDGTQLAALVGRDFGPRIGRSAVFVVKADGNGTRLFTRWSRHVGWDGLTWQPVS